MQYGEGAEFGLKFIQAMQFVMLVFFVSAFALRFAFPSFSTELKTAWILATAPIRMYEVLKAKMVFFALLFLAMACAVAPIHLMLIGLPGLSLGVFLLFTVVSVITITAFGTGLGAAFPNFETSDPQVLSTTIPGLFFIAVALAYGILGAFTMYHGGAELLGIFGVSSLLLIAGSTGIAKERLAALEFVPEQ